MAETEPGDRAAIRDAVIEIIRPYAKNDPDSLGADTQLDKIGVDSFDFVEIVFKLEEQFGIEIDYNVNSTFANIATVGALADQVATLVEAKKAA